MPRTLLSRKIQTFGRLASWSQCLERTSLVSVLIRHQEHRHLEVQCCLLSHAGSHTKARLKIQWPEPDTNGPPILDLTSHDTTASFIFLFWLYNRRLPSLKRDCDLLNETTTEKLLRSIKPYDPLEAGEDAEVSDREKKETFDISLIHAWVLGACLRSAKFQNDVLRAMTTSLDAEEVDARRSSDPNYRSAIS